MQVFLLRGDCDYHVLRPEDESFWLGRSGVASSGRWSIPRLIPYDDDRADAGPLLPVDALPLNAAADGLVMSERARRLLGPLLRSCGEFLPVYVLDESFWWFNCLRSIDALSAGTTGEWVEGGGERFLALVHQLVFGADRVREAPPVFRVPELPAGYLFARQSFRDLVERCGLIGFQFDLVWSDSSGGVTRPPGFGLDFNDPVRAEAKRSALKPD